uniref:rRNA adenine N(6)-methyltransferase n=1 Tax=Glossina morsitans morsitans TaxID=37546 RepID=A0A1B0FHF6_GLOMM
MFTFNKLFSFAPKRLQFYCEYANLSKLKTRKQRKAVYGELFPQTMLNKKHNAPTHMYLANEETANLIDKQLDRFFKQSPCDTILEINPGICLLTKKLLNREKQFKKIVLIESTTHFVDRLQEMHYLYPDRVKFKQGDFLNIRKLVHMDKMDNGSRVVELLSDLPCKEYHDDTNMILFGAVGCYQFFKHLLNSIMFGNSFLNLGRAEMYLIMPPPIYLHLTCNKDVGYLLYRSTSILFQILFEYRFIEYLPRDSFLPLQSEYFFNKRSKLKKILSVDADKLYLTRIVPRRNLHELCSPEDLRALWYFVTQNCISRRNRIIPNLEKWIPGCGARLLVNNGKSEQPPQFYTDEQLSKLPEFSPPCKVLSAADALPPINIYTEFGDLNPNQMLALFRKFRTWPEYKESSFLASLESTLLRTVTTSDDLNESLAEEEDITTETSNEIQEELNTKKSSKPKRTKKEKPSI